MTIAAVAWGGCAAASAHARGAHVMHAATTAAVRHRRPANVAPAARAAGGATGSERLDPRVLGNSYGLGSLGEPGVPLGTGVTGIASSVTTHLALTAIGAWVAGGATFVLKQTARILGQTTAPRLDSTWFSSAYWKVAGISSVLTLPFLFAASVQALIRSDLTLLVRAAAGYLPIAMVTVAIAAPLTMLLLSASDQLAGVVSQAAGHGGVNFLAGLVVPLGGLSAASGSPFLAFLMALFTVIGALMLWIELLIRQAGVYVIVLLLPVAFAAFVWPARRIWAIRSLELLLALILSKLLIVAVLSLGGAALGNALSGGLTDALAGLVLLVLAAFAPWALLRLVPLAELASSAAGGLRGHAGSGVAVLRQADAWVASESDRWVTRTATMRRSAEPTTWRSVGRAIRHSPETTDQAPADHEVVDAAGVDPTARVSRDFEPGATDPGSPLELEPDQNGASPEAESGPEWIMEGPELAAWPDPREDPSREPGT